MQISAENGLFGMAAFAAGAVILTGGRPESIGEAFDGVAVTLKSTAGKVSGVLMSKAVSFKETLLRPFSGPTPTQNVVFGGIEGDDKATRAIDGSIQDGPGLGGENGSPPVENITAHIGGSPRDSVTEDGDADGVDRAAEEEEDEAISPSVSVTGDGDADGVDRAAKGEGDATSTEGSVQGDGRPDDVELDTEPGSPRPDHEIARELVGKATEGNAYSLQRQFLDRVTEEQLAALLNEDKTALNQDAVSALYQQVRLASCVAALENGTDDQKRIIFVIKELNRLLGCSINAADWVDAHGTSDRERAERLNRVLGRVQADQPLFVNFDADVAAPAGLVREFYLRSVFAPTMDGRVVFETNAIESLRVALKPVSRPVRAKKKKVDAPKEEPAAETKPQKSWKVISDSLNVQKEDGMIMTTAKVIGQILTVGLFPISLLAYYVICPAIDWYRGVEVIDPAEGKA